MRRHVLTSCASSLVMALMLGRSAVAQQSYNVPSGQTETVAGPITDTSTPTNVSVTGGGTLLLTNPANSYSNGTSVAGNSTLQVGTDSNLGNASGSLTLGDATTSGVLSVANPNQTFNTQRSILLNAGGGGINAAQAPFGVYLNGPISGSGGLTVTGGVVALQYGANSYSGSTTVNGNGNLVISNDAQLGASTSTTPNTINLGDTSGTGALIVSPNATPFTSARNININGVGYVSGSAICTGASNCGVTLSGLIGGDGALNVNGGYVALTNSGNTYAGGTSVTNGGQIQVNADAVLGDALISSVGLGNNTTKGSIFWNNLVAVSSSRTFVIGAVGGEIDTNSTASVTLTGSIVGTGPLTIGGTGALVLSGANLYTGDTYVSKGAFLQIGADENLGGYSATTNTITGLTGYTQVLDNMLHLDGGTLQFNANTTVTHSIDLTANNGIIDSAGTTDTLSNPISGVGGLTVVNSNTTTAGNIILDGINTYTGGTTVASGTLTIGDAATPTASVTGTVTVNSGGTLAGAGTVAGTIVNNGTVAPANALTAYGYTQSSTGTLSPQIGAGTSAVTASGSPGSSPAQLNVKGAASINGGTLGVVYLPGFLHAGQYQIFTASGGITGAFSSEQAGNPSLGLTSAIVQEGDSYYLVLTQKASLPDFDRPSIIPVLSAAAVDEAQQATSVLLDRLTTARTNALADQLGVAMSEQHRVRGASPYGLWVQPTGNSGTVTGNSGVDGYSSQGGGLIMGIDTEWTPSVSIGVSFGYSNSFIKQTGNASGTISVPRLAVYGGWWHGPFALDAVAGVGLGQLDSNRPVNDGVTLQEAHANRNANEKTAALQASAAFAFDGWVIGPALGVKYLNMDESSFTETGTTLYNFSVASTSMNSLRPYGNVGLTKRFMITDHWALVPDIKAGIEHEVIDQLHHIEAQTQGDAQLFQYVGLLPGTDILRLDGGLKLETSRDMAFYVDYDHLQSSSSNSQYISGGFRYRL